jgi:hypothetical protein
VLKLLHSGLELVVKSGFVYVPLPFDPDIAREIRDRSDPEGQLDKKPPGASNTAVEVGGRQFVKSIGIQSVLANYERIDKDHHEKLKKDYLGESPYFPDIEPISPNGKLETIILRIMPYFVRKNKGLQRRRQNDEELLELVCGKIDVPADFVEKAEKYLDTAPLLQRLRDLARLEQTVEPLREGTITGETLRRWVRKALEARMVKQEMARVEQKLRERELLGESRRNRIAALLYIAEKGSFELDGFGFFRMGSGDDYLIYKHTGEYILKDYYARSYLFPDCRVAVPTFRPFRPIVLETYKHPFLFGHAPKQEICISGYEWPDEFTAGNIISVLEEGINALLYGYDARRRNGHHSLDPTLQYIKTIEFEDYRV